MNWSLQSQFLWPVTSVVLLDSWPFRWSFQLLIGLFFCSWCIHFYAPNVQTFTLEFNNDGPVTGCLKSLDGFRGFMVEYRTNSSVVMFSSWVYNCTACWYYKALILERPSMLTCIISFPVSHFQPFLSAVLFAHSTFLFYRVRSFHLISKPSSRCCLTPFWVF